MRSGLRSARVRKMIGTPGQGRDPPDALADVQAVGVRQHDVEQESGPAALGGKARWPLYRLQTGQREAFLLQVVLRSENRSTSSSMSRIFFMGGLVTCSNVISGDVTERLSGREFGIKAGLSAGALARA